MKKVLELLAIIAFSTMCIVITIVAANNYQIDHYPTIIRVSNINEAFDIQGRWMGDGTNEYILEPYEDDVKIIVLGNPIDKDILRQKLAEIE